MIPLQRRGFSKWNQICLDIIGTDLMCKYIKHITVSIKMSLSTTTNIEFLFAINNKPYSIGQLVKGQIGREGHHNTHI